MICIYHNKDLDGFCSGAIVKHRYPEAQLIGYDYGEPFKWKEIPENEEIIMVDISMPMKEMHRLASHSNWQLTWIDHHISAINDYKEYIAGTEGFLTPVLDVSFAACELAWKYLFPEKPLPNSVLLLGEYDTWRKSDQLRWDNTILPFQYGMRGICNSAETFPIKLFYNSEFNYDITWQMTQIKMNGVAILNYQRQQNERACKMAFEAYFNGLNAICLNVGGANSTVFESVYNPEKHDIMIPFVFTGQFWKISLFTTKDNVNCSEIAKSLGGGGHKMAAGFESKELPRFLQNFIENNINRCPATNMECTQEGCIPGLKCILRTRR